MAVETSKAKEPILILNDHESLEKLIKDVTVFEGQSASPDTFNKNIIDSIDRDINLEAAITYMARSASLYTTDKAKFLSHCEGDGVDIISYKSPFTGESGIDPKELFTTDNIFLGAAYPQGKVKNMVDKDFVYNKYPCIGTETEARSGWKTGSTLTQGENVVMVEDATNSYLSISNENITGQKKAGTIVFASNKLLLKDTKGDIPSTISAGFTLKTGNLILSNACVKLTVNMYEHKASQNPIEGGSFTKIVDNVAEYNDVISLENLVLPAAIKRSSDPAFDIVITVVLSSNSTPITMYLSKIMAHEGEALYTWTEGSREEAYLQYGTNASSTRAYNGIVDLENNDEATVWFWSKFTDYSIKQTLKPIGPVFLSWKGTESELSLGFVHKHDLDNLEMCLAINKNGEVTYSTEKVTLPNSYFGKYFLSALRFRKGKTETTEEPTIILEVAFALEEGKILTISKTFAKTYFPQVNEKLPPAIIVLGKDVCVDSSMTSNNDIFSSKISEVRYDAEWINDLELYLTSLGRKPFSFKQSTDAQITTKQQSTTEVIDAAGINLVNNPTGKYALIGWNQYNTGTNFIVSHTDSTMGNCFNYTGTPSNNVLIYSEPIEINGSLPYTLRAYMKTRENDTGKVLIGVRFQNSSIFHPEASTLSDLQAECSKTGKAAYYSTQGTSPSSAKYAFVYMYVEALSNVSAFWSKIKLEQGSSPTFFTEDCGFNYALYA